jgi:hypothetical protein
MEDYKIILVGILILAPIGLFIYMIDYRIKPMLKKTRHDLLYITAVETLILLYTLCLSFVFKVLKMDNIVSFANYGLFMSMMLLIVFTACVTLVWWLGFFIRQLLRL